MLPLNDKNPTLHTAYATIAIIVLNLLAWIFVQHLGSTAGIARSLCTLALIPGELLHLADAGTLIPVGHGIACQLEAGAPLYTVVTSMFLHGGWLHIGGNMLFLWVFGDNVEDALGTARFVMFYLLCGLAAAAAQIATDPASVAPMVGASGAIAGVLGAYMRLYPSARVQTLVFLGIFATIVAIPAWVLLGMWFGLQLLSGLPALGRLGGDGGVAFWAHIGGFVAGVLLIGPMHNPALLAEHRAFGRRQSARWR